MNRYRRRRLFPPPPPSPPGTVYIAGHVIPAIELADECRYQLRVFDSYPKHVQADIRERGLEAEEEWLEKTAGHSVPMFPPLKKE